MINPPIRLRGRPRLRRNPVSPFQGLRPKKGTDLSDPGRWPGLCSSAPSGLILASVALVPPVSSRGCRTCSGKGERCPVSVNLSSLGWRSTSKKRGWVETGLGGWRRRAVLWHVCDSTPLVAYIATKTVATYAPPDDLPTTRSRCFHFGGVSAVTSSGGCPHASANSPLLSPSSSSRPSLKWRF